MQDTLPINSYLQDFVGAPSRTLPAWVQAVRAEAGARFGAVGFPTRRDEEWRFTNVAPILEIPFRPAGREASQLTPSQLVPFTYDGLNGAHLVFVNGHYAPHLSRTNGLPEGVTVSSLADAMDTHTALVQEHLAQSAKFDAQAFVALGTAALDDGAFVHIPRGVVLEQPLHLLFVSSPTDGPTLSHPRTLIVAEDNSQCTLVESYAGPAEAVYFTNAVTEVAVGENAVVDHYKVQRESLAAFHVATMQVTLARAANFSSHSIGLGGRLVRNDANAYLGAEGIECTLNGLYRAGGRQLVDNHTAIDHAYPHCNSHEVYKGILDGRARGVFNGKIYVRPDAQKTDAKQTNQTLLLSPDAQIDTKPQLEIFADDVKCTHGATIGQLSGEALFYLRARGIPEVEARSLLVYAFAADIVRRIKVDAVRAQLDHALLAERSLEGLQS